LAEVQLGWRAINAFPLNPSPSLAVLIVKVYENKIWSGNMEKMGESSIAATIYGNKQKRKKCWASCRCLLRGIQRREQRKKVRAILSSC
jgi:hypothetical protein